MKKSNVTSIILLVVFFLFAESYPQEEKGKIYGSIRDVISLQPLPGANILVMDTNMGAASDADGNYIIESIEPGTYRIRISSVGYMAVIKTDVVVNPIKPIRIDVELQEMPYQLNEITVQDDYFFKSPIEIISTAKFSFEEIRRSPGAFEDVVRALSVLPGVAQADAGRNDLIIRGGAPYENLFLVDGIKIPNINHFGNQGATGGPISYVNLDFVKSTTFSTGGFPVTYGNKLSSVLSIKLKDGRSDRIGGKATISSSQFGLNLEGPITQNSDFIFSARRSYLDIIFKAAGFAFVPEYYDMISKLNIKLNSGNNLSFFFLGALDKVNFFNDTPEKRFDNSRIIGSNQKQYTIAGKYQKIFERGFLDISLSRNYVNYNSAQKDTLQNPLYTNLSTEAENSAKSELTLKVSSENEINIGAELSLIEFNSDVYSPSIVTSFGDLLDTINYKTNVNYFKWGGYLNYNSILSEKFLMNLGIRGDYFDGINTKYYFSPRLSLSYRLTPESNISISGGIYYQTPSYLWLNNDKNRDLKSIKVNQYILGYENRLKEDILFKVEGFIKDYSNYPVSTIRPYLILANTGAGFSDDNYSSLGLDPLQSTGKGLTRGIEFSVQKKLSEIPYYGIISLTISKSDFTSLDRVSCPGLYDQNILFNISGGYKFNSEWEGSFKFRLATGSPYTPFDNYGRQSVSDYNSKRLVPSHSLDIRVDKRWNFSSWVLITYIDIQNIYNRKNTNSVRWDPRVMKVDETSSIGILPSIGISAEI
jgi:outer membrane receptor for ferrienterochelin and colicin